MLGTRPPVRAVQPTARGGQQTSSRSRQSRVSGLSATQPSSSPRTRPAGAAMPHSRSGTHSCPAGCGGRAARDGPARCGRAGRGARRRPRRSASGSPSRSGTAAAPTRTSPRRRTRRRRPAAPARPGRPRWPPPAAPPRSAPGRAPTARSRRRPGTAGPAAVTRSPCGTPSCSTTSPQRRPEDGSGMDSTSIRAGSSRRPQTTSASPSGDSRTAALPSSMPTGSPARRLRRRPGTFSPYACQARRASGQSWSAVAAMPDVPPVRGAGLAVQQGDGAQPGGPRLLPVVPELVQQRQVEPGLRQPGLQVGGAGQQRARVLVPAVADQRERAVGGLPPRGGGPVPYLPEDPHDSRLPVPLPCGPGGQRSRPRTPSPSHPTMPASDGPLITHGLPSSHRDRPSRPPLARTRRQRTPRPPAR